MSYQGFTKTDGKVDILAEFDGQEIIGWVCNVESLF